MQIEFSLEPFTCAFAKTCRIVFSSPLPCAALSADEFRASFPGNAVQSSSGSTVADPTAAVLLPGRGPAEGTEGPRPTADRAISHDFAALQGQHRIESLRRFKGLRKVR